MVLVQGEVSEFRQTKSAGCLTFAEASGISRLSSNLNLVRMIQRETVGAGGLCLTRERWQNDAATASQPAKVPAKVPAKGVR